MRVLRYRRFVFTHGNTRVFGFFSFQIVAMERNDGLKLYQYGRKGKEIKFVCILPRHLKETPRFLLSQSWHRVYNSSRIIAGIAKKPRDFNRFWEG